MDGDGGEAGWVRATHTIAARVLGLVQGVIRDFDESFMASHFVTVLSDAVADGRLNGGCSIEDARLLDSASNAFRIFLGTFQCGFRQQYAEFLSTATRRTVKFFGDGFFREVAVEGAGQAVALAGLGEGVQGFLMHSFINGDIRAVDHGYADMLDFIFVIFDGYEGAVLMHIFNSVGNRAVMAEDELRSARAKRDEMLVVHIERVWEANLQVYGADKVWKQMNREGVPVARCTVERLMRHLGLHGARRGKTIRTTVPDRSAPCPLDRVNRQFKADRPNQLWVSDFTYVSTWQGWLYVAFVIDVFARRIVGWRVSGTMTTDFVLDALEQALYARQPDSDDALIHHSDRGSQYVSIRTAMAAVPSWRRQSF